jgi:hypothetical protein
VGSIEKIVMFLSKYSLDRNNTISSLYRTQYTPDFLIAEHYGLRTTIFWVTEDLTSGWCVQTEPCINLQMAHHHYVQSSVAKTEPQGPEKKYFWWSRSHMAMWLQRR